MVVLDEFAMPEDDTNRANAGEVLDWLTKALDRAQSREGVRLVIFRGDATNYLRLESP